MRSDERPADPHEAIPPDWEGIARFLAGESGDDESRAVAAWLDAHPADAALVRSVHAVAGEAIGARAEPAQVDVEAALARVKARRTMGPGRDRSRRVPRATLSARPRARGWMGWSGGLLAAAAALLLFVRSDRGDDASRAAPAPMLLATAAGARDSLRLPDGTRVVLGPASRLTWDARDARLVSLEGIAHFTVVHDAAHPFTVRAGDAVVRDVGTAFVVRADSGAMERVSVAVSEGVVSLARRAGHDPLGARDGVTLRAGDRGELAAGRTVVQRGGLDPADTAWAAGRLVYQATPLDRVIADVARWYDVHLRVADGALLARRITATFDARDPPDRVVNAIAVALGATVARESGGRVAVLRPAPAR
ncbi:MAG: FecR family protein [Gemmatimonadaceae bacterium]